jgi:hypothetical protein
MYFDNLGTIQHKEITNSIHFHIVLSKYPSFNSHFWEVLASFSSESFAFPSV